MEQLSEVKPLQEFSVDKKLLLDILSDGGDYACRGYWGQIDEYKWYWWYVRDAKGEPIYPEQISPEITDDTVLWRIRDDEDGEAEAENRPFVDITLRKLEEATKWALVFYKHLFPSWNVSGLVIDDIDYDALGADVIIQKIVLGEVVYG